ncbi:hypothetical protein ACLOJK_032760 [Asimina triloba]
MDGSDRLRERIWKVCPTPHHAQQFAKLFLVCRSKTLSLRRFSFLPLRSDPSQALAGKKNRPRAMERRKRFRSTAQISLLLVLFLSFCCHLSAISITVNDVECVYEYVLYEGDTVSGNFVVVDHDIFWSSDHPGIDLTVRSELSAVGPPVEVTSPSGNTVHSLKGTSGDKFEFKAPRSGMYKFCFHNPYSTPETVSFYIHVGHIPNEHDLAKDEHLDPINVKIAELREALESVTAEQKYLKARDTRHRHTNESTRRRLVLYTLAEYLALAVASGLQVAYIRRLFSKSVAYNRV